MRITRTLFASLITVAALGMAACAPAGSGADSSSGSLSFSLNTDPATFDPSQLRGSDDFTVSRFLYDTLLHGDEDNTFAAGLASDWETIDAANYVFTIRDGAVCGDGTPITPTIVANSLARFADPETASTGRSLAFGDATATFTPDDEAGTVTVALSTGWSDFLSGMALPHAGIVCPAGLEDLDGLAAGTVEGAFSGPYTLTSSTPAVSYELTLRDGYDTWPEYATPLTGTPATEITLRPITDYTTIATQLIAGDLDVGVVSDENVTRFDGNDGFSVVDSVNTTTYLQFNEREGATFADQPELRRAVAQVVDAAVFSDISTDGRGEAILSVSAPSVACVNTDASLIPAIDEAAAAELLDGVKIRIVGTTLLSAGNEYVAEVLRNAGADVTVDSLDNASWSTLTSAGGTDWDINVQGDQNVLGTLTSSLLRVMGPASEDGGRNKGAAVNEEGYAALQSAMLSDNPDDVCGYMQTAQETFLERTDAVPLSTIPASNVVRDGVQVRVINNYLEPATIRFSE